MNITFIGTGYVGLVSGVMMSYLGHDITCLDTDSHKIRQLQNNILPIYEPKLAELLPSLVQSGKLKFVDNYNAELRNSRAIFVTVGTPPLPSGEADLQYIFAAIDNLCQWIEKDCLIVIKSTVPPTTCNQIVDYLKKKNLEIHIASNPEFLREGNAVDDFLNSDRILIGTNSSYAEELLKEIYLPLTSKNIPLISTDLVTSELSKYAANAFLATKIAFTNEMANLCEKIKANIKDLSYAIGLDKRIGKEFLNVGPGFGGSCFPKDLLALSQISQKYQSICQILEAVISGNSQRPYDMVDKICLIIGKDLIGKNITILGLTFKAGTDDIRSSPAIKIIEILLDKGATIRAFDPIGMDNTKQYFKKFNYDKMFFASDEVSACHNSDIIIVATEWSNFKDLDWATIHAQVKSPIIMDFRNILDSAELKSTGFKYYPIGISDEI
jgi:UDPglucose 6-dehydrogenase